MVGGGPAGCAAAIVLAGSGAAVALLERSAYEGIRIGETLPPEVRLLLERLGLWDRFQDDGHTPSPGILAAWGQPEPYDNDFIMNPYGSGWRVDRNRFDSMLASGARAAGAVVLRGTAVNRCVRQRDRGWELTVTGGEGVSSVSAAFVVDATGRSSSFCRALGARRVVHDRMVALVRIMSLAVDGATVDRRALIEATADGWWYSAWLPDSRLVLSFQTDAGTGMRAGWDQWLAGAPQTAARAAVATGGDVRVVSANSHRSEPVAGDGWLAVGDAAAAHDPICGLGILWALESGVAGAEAVRSSAAAGYEVAMGERFDRYLATRTRYYRAESRWPDAPFWRRRHLDAASSSRPLHGRAAQPPHPRPREVGEARIEHVAYAVAQEVEPEDGEADGDPGDEDDMRVGEEVHASVVQHGAPLGRGGRAAQAEEAEPGDHEQ